MPHALLTKLNREKNDAIQVQLENLHIFGFRFGDAVFFPFWGGFLMCW
jgi:hypothetical protein